MTIIGYFSLSLIVLAIGQLSYMLAWRVKEKIALVFRPIQLKLKQFTQWKNDEPLVDVKLAWGLATVPGKRQDCRALCKIDGQKNYQSLIIWEELTLGITRVIDAFKLEEPRQLANLRVKDIRLDNSTGVLDFLCICQPVSARCLLAAVAVAGNHKRAHNINLTAEQRSFFNDLNSNLLEVVLVVMTSDFKVVLVEANSLDKKGKRNFGPTHSGLLEVGDWTSNDLADYNGVIVKACKERALASVIPPDQLAGYSLDLVSIKICGMIDQHGVGRRRLLCAGKVPVTSAFVFRNRTAEAVHFDLQSNVKLGNYGDLLAPEIMETSHRDVSISEETEVILERIRASFYTPAGADIKDTSGSKIAVGK